MTGAVPTAAITRDVFQDITDLRGQGIDRLELAGLALQKAGDSSIEAVASWISPLDSASDVHAHARLGCLSTFDLLLGAFPRTAAQHKTDGQRQDDKPLFPCFHLSLPPFN